MVTEVNKRWSKLAVWGFILSFCAPYIGIVLCILGLRKIKEEELRGKGLAIAGIIISLFVLLILVAAIFSNQNEFNDQIKNVEKIDSASDESKECTGTTFEQICINKKIDECTKLCAGEDIEIPAVKNECYSSCYQVYYSGGEKDLDGLIKEYRG